MHIYTCKYKYKASLMAQLVKKKSACSVGDLGSIPGLGRSAGGGHGNPLQYSCLENPHGQRSLVHYRQHEEKLSLCFCCCCLVT